MKLFVLLCIGVLFSQYAYCQNNNTPLFPLDICSDANYIYVANRGCRSVDVLDIKDLSVVNSLRFEQIPTGIICHDSILYVTSFENKGELFAYSTQSFQQLFKVATGHGAASPIINEKEEKIYVLNRYESTIYEHSLRSGKIERRVAVQREPTDGVIDRSGKYLFVVNFLPNQRADVDYVAADISVIRLSDFTKVKDIKLANGSNAVRGIAISSDGKYIFASHNLGRFQVPTTQLQQGWMNTSAFSVIDVEELEFLGAVPVDDPDHGAAGVWDIQCNDNYIYLTHSGTHELSVIDYSELMNRFLSSSDRFNINYDLTFLYGLRKRIPLYGNGPRNMCASNGKLYIPTFFADTLNILDCGSAELTFKALNPERIESNIDKGERYFNDAKLCFQGWQSCNGCHPGNGRTDGMNWDLLNDGIGNPKNCKSLLYSHVTPPCMISGIRESAELAVVKGFNLIQFADITPEQARCVDEYLMSLEAVPSPYLVDGQLSERAKKGEKIYKELRCDYCHRGQYTTDMKLHVIGQDVEFEKGWDTPTLNEVWRTAPYLFDGRAATIYDVISEHKHGIHKKLSEQEKRALEEYINSL